MRRVYLAPLSWGLGDLVLSLPVVHSLIDRGDHVWLVTRSPLQEGIVGRIDGLAGSVREEEFACDSLGDGGHYVNLRDHPLQTDYWWGSEKFERDYPGWLINDILHTICSDMHITIDLERLRPLSCIERPEAAGKIVFLPGSDGTYKCWPTAHWLELHSLLSQAGREVVVVGEPERSKEVSELVAAGLPWQPSPRLADAIDIVSSADLVVAVDTGLMHVSVQQGRPTVALYRHKPVYVRPYAHVAALSAGPCPAICREKAIGCSTNELLEFRSFVPESWQCAAGESERCMSGIKPQDVFDVVMKKLAALSSQSLPAGGGR